MAANVPASSATKESPLSSFDRVSKIVYLYRPKPVSAGRSSSGAAPKLILVGGWMDAREPHLAKYTAKLQALYPDSPIVLVRSFAYHFMGSKFPGEIAPAVPVIRSILAGNSAATTTTTTSSSKRRPEMLVHVFSNGGSTALRYLYDLYRKTAGPGEEPSSLPLHVTIFDSAPGRFEWSRSVTAFSLGAVRSNFLVRVLVAAMAHLLSAFYWILTVPWGRPGFLERTWLAHNVKTKNSTEVGRTYVYSKEDKLVDYRDVEEHAAQAREQGYQVALEKFQGTAHVAHARGDEARYWSIVRDTWDRGAAQ